MSQCSQCGHPRDNSEARCQNCGGLNSKIDEILAREEAERDKNTLKGKLKKIIFAEDKKEELSSQYEDFKSSLSKRAMFTLFVIFVFIFAMTFTVI